MIATRPRSIRALLLGCAVLAASAHSAVVYEDFETGSASRWLATSTTGTTTNGVETKNGSRMAFVKQVGGGTSALGIDFPYVAASFLSFDMVAVAVTSSSQFVSAGSGATLSFNDVFNVELGRVSFYNLTHPATPPAKTIAVDQLQHTYTATMADFASRAGVPAAAAIAKISLSFGGFGGTFVAASATSTGTVHFDNVIVTSSGAAIDCLFAWAERTYASAVAPAGATTAFIAPFSYRYYSGTDSYVGVSAKDNRVYYLDARRQMVDLGELPGWLATAGCRI